MKRRIRRLAGKPRGLWRAWQGWRWARSELASVKARLPAGGLGVRATPPTGIAPRGWIGVNLALRRVSPTCLERALVLQAWFSVARPAPDVVIGVRAGEQAHEAHAWLDGETSEWFDASYGEIHRLQFSEIETSG